MRPRKLKLQDGPPVRTLAMTVGALSEAGLPPGDYYMGGGTVLAARWDHRASTDIDLFIHPQRYREMLQGIGGEKRIAGILESAGAREIQVSSRWIRWETSTGPSGIFSSVPVMDPHLSAEVEAEHLIPLEKTSSILAKKIAGRMLTLADLVDRDAYDLVACAKREPEALIEAVRTVGREDCEHIAEEIRHVLIVNPNWEGNPASSNREIIRPDDEGMTGRALWREVSDLFRDGAEAYIEGLRRREPLQP